MGEKSDTTAPVVPATEEVVVVPAAEKPTTTIEKETLPVPEAEPEKPAAAVAEAVAEKPKEETSEAATEEEKITESASFKEESNVVGELPDPEKKALDELKLLIQEALNKHEFTAQPTPPPAKEEEKPAEAPAPETTEAEKTETAATVVEEPKAEEKSEAPVETPAPEAPPAVETKEDEKAATPPPPAAEPSEKAAATPPPPPAAEPSATAVDEEKTVEAIKETIIEVSAAPPPEEAPPAEPPVVASEETPAAPPPPPEEVSLWGIPLLADEKSDVILLKFLRARDFKVKDAFTMIKNTVRWQKEFGIEALLEEDEELGADLEKVVFMSGFDKEGHPVCYNAYGEFQNKELYQKIFADEEKREKFLRWRIRFLEKSIRKLDFSPDGISTIVQVNDLKNSPGPFKRELRLATNQALQLLQDNYPEFVAKQVFINVPWWYLAFYRMISPFFTLRSKSKFVFAGPSKSAETLFKYIAPEQVPVQYGGLSREGDQEFTTADSVTEDTIKPTSKHTIEFPVTEKSVLVWEVRVVGWDVSYGAEFVPSAEEGYTVIVQKSTKITTADEPIVSNSFKISEPGKVVLTFDNQTSKKKKLLYRSKTKPSD